MGGNGNNTALRGLLDEAEMSNTGLAAAVAAAAAREGIHLGTSTTTIKRMLDGSQPRWPAPRLVAAVLSGRLQREVSVTDCGFVDRSPPGEDPYDGLRCAGTLDGAIRTVVELTGRDMRRRKLLLGSAFSVAAFAEPALFALTTPPAQATARAGNQRVGMADVEVLNEQVGNLHKLSAQYGSGRVRGQLVALLHGEANRLLHGSYTEKTGKALLSAVARATSQAGTMTGDVGRHALAQRYYIQALDLAMRAGDRYLAADTLAEAGRLTARIGEDAPPGQDTSRHGRQAVALARSGLTIAQDAAAPALAAKLHATEGRGFALLGDVRETRHAVSATQRCYDTVTPEDGAGIYVVNAFGQNVGRCLLGIGDTEQAITFSTMALDGAEPWMVRGRCASLTLLAGIHLQGRDLEQAAAYGRDALRAATTLSSTVATDRLRTLHRQVAPLRAVSRHLADLDDRISEHLTRTAREHHSDPSCN
jgi:tetratricopeptide (TPR) repeat protein